MAARVMNFPADTDMDKVFNFYTFIGKKYVKFNNN